jgi:hypothetical protein
MKNINPTNVLALLSKELAEYPASTVTREDIDFAEVIARVIKQCASSDSTFGTETVLELCDTWCRDDEEEESEPVPGDMSAASGEGLSESQLKEALEFYRSSRTGTRILSSMNKKFRFIKGPQHIRQLLQ